MIGSAVHKQLLTENLNIGKLYMFEYFANKHGHFINQLTTRSPQKPIVVGKPGDARS